jgi:hypothetical protein
MLATAFLAVQRAVFPEPDQDPELEQAPDPGGKDQSTGESGATG